MPSGDRESRWFVLGTAATLALLGAVVWLLAFRYDILLM